MKTVYDSVCQKLGYYFRDPELLDRALRHRSLGQHSNERLEFLGDSILSFIIADELFYRYPEMKEGELSRLRSNLVNGEVLAELAGELQIGEHIKFGHSELKSNGPKSKAILADTLEAIVGAIYLDSGTLVTQRHVLEWFDERLHNLAGIVQKDPKTRLQELQQMKKQPLPIYEMVEVVDTPHTKNFKVACMIAGLTESVIGSGTNKRAAERNAAEKMLEKLSRNSQCHDTSD